MPEDLAPQFGQITHAALQGHEVISSQLSNLAVESTTAVRHQDLGLAESMGVDQQLTWVRMARVILKWKRNRRFFEGNPNRLTTPAAVKNGGV